MDVPCHLLLYSQQQPQSGKELIRSSAYLLNRIRLAFLPLRSAMVPCFQRRLEQRLAQFNHLGGNTLLALSVEGIHFTCTHSSPLNALSRIDGSMASSSAETSACLRFSISTFACRSSR